MYQENSIEENVDRFSDLLIQTFRNALLLTGLALSSLILAANDNKKLSFIGELLAIIVTVVTIYVNYHIGISYQNFIKKYTIKELNKFTTFRLINSMMLVLPLIVFAHILIIGYSIFRFYKKL